MTLSHPIVIQRPKILRSGPIRLSASVGVCFSRTCHFHPQPTQTSRTSACYMCHILSMTIHSHISVPSSALAAASSPAPSPFLSSAGIAQQPPCVAYQGLRSEVAGNANARRVDAYIRHRNQSSANTPRTRIATSGGQPINPFGSLPTNQSSAIARSSSLAASSSSSLSVVSSASNTSGHRQFSIVLIPHVVSCSASDTRPTTQSLLAIL